jgi:hypothetical protein
MQLGRRMDTIMVLLAGPHLGKVTYLLHLQGSGYVCCWLLLLVMFVAWLCGPQQVWHYGCVRCSQNAGCSCCQPFCLTAPVGFTGRGATPHFWGCCKHNAKADRMSGSKLHKGGA